MTAPRKLALYALLLAAVLGASMAVGSAAGPVGLANAEPEPEEHGGGEMEQAVPGLAAADASTGLRLVADSDTLAAGARTPYRFRIVGRDGVRTEFDVEHTRRMHVIVVRRDFAGFQHVHPEMDAATGTWTTPLTIHEPGTYRVFADFVADGEKQTLATDLFVAGDFRPRPLPRPSTAADAADGYTVELVGDAVVGEESTLDFVVRRGERVVDDLSPYLGARGHLVALRAGDLGYLHVHADAEDLSFAADFPTAGDYRLFLQFRHRGEVRTAAFTVRAEEGSR